MLFLQCSNFELMFRLLIGTIEFLVAYIFIRNFFNRRGTEKLKPILTILLFAVLVTGVNLLRLPYVNTAVLAVLYFLFTQILFLGHWVQKAKLCIIFIGLSAISEIGVSFMSVSAMQLVSERGVRLDELVTPAIISKVILILLVVIIIRIFPKKYNPNQSNESPWLLVFPILGVASMYVILYMQQGQSSEESTMLPLMAFGLMIPLSTLAPLLIYDSNLEKHRLESELKLIEERQQANDVFYRAQQRSLEESHRRSHDYKNHLMNLRALYGHGSPEAEAYYDSLMDSLITQGDPCPIEMGNKVVSNIIARVRRQCAQNNIRFQLNVDCRDLSFLQMLDASAILDNALDNAIQACRDIPPERRRFIELGILERAHFVVMQVKNSKCNAIIERDGKLISSKPDQKSHGFGVENIRIAARKYGGDIIYEYDDNTFTFSVRLNKGV